MQKVFLLHGLWMRGFTCNYWRKAMLAAGFSPTIFSYPSAAYTLDQNADRLFKTIQKNTTADQKIHLVGHSLGGIVILHMIRRHAHQLPNLGRVVLCCSPINGSHVIDTSHQWPMLYKALGRTISKWEGIKASELPEQLEVGVIAGTRPFGLGRVLGKLPQPNDGTVALSETHFDGAKDQLALNINHSEVLFSAVASNQIVEFIRNGIFDHETSSATQ